MRRKKKKKRGGRGKQAHMLWGWGGHGVPDVGRRQLSSNPSAAHGESIRQLLPHDVGTAFLSDARSPPSEIAGAC